MPMPMPYMGYPSQYPPQQYPPYPQNDKNDKKYQKTNSFKSSIMPPKIINKAKRKLKKYFFVVLFTKYLKS